MEYEHFHVRAKKKKVVGFVCWLIGVEPVVFWEYMMRIPQSLYFPTKFINMRQHAEFLTFGT